MSKNSFEKISSNGVVYFRSAEIATPHGFSTRLGGVSKAAYLATMNFGRTLGDDPAAVDENYRRAGAAMGFDPDRLVYTNQIHSTTVRAVTTGDINKTFNCDGFVTAERGVVLAVRTADCVPILFCDSKAGVIGAAHAGWRGTAGGIQVETVRQMTAIGACAKDIHVAIGSCIHKCCYEVGIDFYNSLTALISKKMTDRYVTMQSGSLHADLVGINCEFLRNCGIPDDNIDVCDYCTCCDSELFFSHRASKGKRGVMSAFITL